jgi:rhomboid protease GluP
MVKTPQGTPLVTYTLLGLTVVIFALQWLTESMLGFDYPAALGVKANELIIQGQLWRLFTPMFLHGGILHIALNMYALLAFGPQLERYYGHGRYLALYLVSGFAGNVASFLFSAAPSLGASTAIFGLLGAEAIFLYRNRKLFGASAQRALTNLIVVAVINLVYGMMGSGIDNWGHIGGLLGGVLFAWFAGPVLQVAGTYPQLEMADTRQTSQVILAGLGVALLFALLAAVKFF